jgi:hypothetical protein
LFVEQQLKGSTRGIAPTRPFLLQHGTDAESDLKAVFLDFRKAIVDEMMKE